MNRPAPVKCAHVRLSVVRGPDADGRWYWRARVSSGGERSMPWSGWATVEEAEIKAGALAQPSAAPPPDPTVRTLRDLLEVWMGHQVQRLEDGAVRPTTVEGYRACARSLARTHGTLPVARLVLPDVLQGIQRALLEASAASTTRQAMLVLRIAWKWAVGEGLVTGALPQIKPPKGRRVYSRATPERDDVARVLDALEPDSWAWRMTFLLAATGARRGEIASLTWARVYLEEGVVEVHGKTGPREVPIGPGVVAELRRWRESASGEWVTGAPPKVLSALWKHLQDACERAGVRRFSAQGLRRAATVALYRAGLVDLESRVLGHSPQVAARDYREVLQQDRQAVHEVLDLAAHRAQRTGTAAKKPG